MNNASQGRCLGLIGGLGVGATIHYYQQLVKAHAARGCVPSLVIVHADVNRVLKDAAAGGASKLAQYLAQLLQRLSQAGAQVAAIPAVTPHVCRSELVKLSPIPLVDLIDEIVREIEGRQLTRVALFGTRMTIGTRLFGQLPGVEVVMPKADEIDSIHQTYVQIVNAASGTEEHYQTLRQIAHRLCEHEKVEAIILAGTELSLVFNETNTDFPHIDVARLHLDAIMRQLFSEPSQL